MPKKKKSIKIDPKNKGKFTERAKAKSKSVQQEANDTLKSKTASALQKKRAQFAKNAKKWKKG